MEKINKDVAFQIFNKINNIRDYKSLCTSNKAFKELCDSQAGNILLFKLLYKELLLRKFDSYKFQTYITILEIHIKKYKLNNSPTLIKMAKTELQNYYLVDIKNIDEKFNTCLVSLLLVYTVADGNLHNITDKQYFIIRDSFFPSKIYDVNHIWSKFLPPSPSDKYTSDKYTSKKERFFSNVRKLSSLLNNDDQRLKHLKRVLQPVNNNKEYDILFIKNKPNTKLNIGLIRFWKESQLQSFFYETILNIKIKQYPVDVDDDNHMPPKKMRHMIYLYLSNIINQKTIQQIHSFNKLNLFYHDPHAAKYEKNSGILNESCVKESNSSSRSSSKSKSRSSSKSKSRSSSRSNSN